MSLGKRAYLGLSGGLSALLTGIVVTDVYADWYVEGNPLWSTAVENVIPIALGVSIFLGGYWIYVTRPELDLETVTRWQFVGAAGLLLIAAEVVGLQMVQGQLKPRLLVLQMTIGGAAAGTVVGYTTASMERTQTELQRERDRFGALYENASAEIVEITLDGNDPRIVSANSQFEKQFFDETDRIGTSLYDVVAHDEETKSAIRDAVAGGETYETELTTATEGGHRYFQLHVIPFETGEGGYLLYTDITELRETRRKLERTVSQLERSNDRLQQFAYVASHDLQEPLRMVSSYVSLLESEYGGELDEEADEYIEFAVDGAERMQDMIDGLLEYSRVRTQGEEFTETDANEVFEETRRDLGLLIDDHDATVIDDDLPAVEADRNQLGQVFRNLIENAIQHGGAGTTVRVGAERRNGEVVFSVADDGPGIPEDQHDRIFEIFEQGNRDDQGTGMGLAICDRIVSRHDGEIWIESSAGTGTTFYFSMPAA